MITEADVRKLCEVRAAGRSVLSLYLGVPGDPAALRGVPARADELLTEAVAGSADRRTVRARKEGMQAVRDLLAVHTREWLGQTAAIFAAAEAGLAEAFPLPCRIPDRAVLAARPHVRPLLVAVQRCPAYQVAVADRQHAWIFQITGTQIACLAQSAVPAVRSPGFGGWYGLESYRVSQRIIQLTRHHYRDTAAMLSQAAQAHGPQPLVIGGHEDEIPALLTALPRAVHDRFIGSFTVDPHALTPARVRELSAPVVERWVNMREQQVAAEILAEPPYGLTAIGLNSCLAAVNARAVKTLVVPVGGLIPGFTCEACGTLASSTSLGCPHGAAAAQPVPDLLEEMVTATLGEGGEVVAVHDPPGDAAAHLRYPLARPPVTA
jgi:Bacterial archaeo-eukaryotic release factor family 10